MGFRFRKQIKILPGVKLNLSKNGLSSVSIGKAGATLNIGQNGAKVTTGIPGTGMSFSQRLTDGNAQSVNTQAGYEPQYYEEPPQQKTFYFTCPSCFKSLEWRFNFCTHCGADVTYEKQKIYALSVGYKECHQCHTINEPASRFCAACGHDFIIGTQAEIAGALKVHGDVALSYISLGAIFERQFKYYAAMMCYYYAAFYDPFKDYMNRAVHIEQHFGFNGDDVLQWICDNAPPA